MASGARRGNRADITAAHSGFREFDFATGYQRRCAIKNTLFARNRFIK
jgi:hypothetical protein